MKKRTPGRYLRILTMLIFVALVIVGLVTNLAPGTLSSFGIESIALICPLGSLEVLIASHTFIPLAVVSLVCLVVLGVLLGRIFCGWVCPVPLYRMIFPGKKIQASDTETSGKAHDQNNENALNDARVQYNAKYTTSAAYAKASGTAQKTTRTAYTQTDTGRKVPPERPHTKKIELPRFDSRFIVLIGALITTAIFGFPVFCLVCPVGITFGFIIGLWRLIGFNEPSWLLLIYPTILILELVVFRKWCHKICPIGAIVSLISSLNVFLRPRVDTTKCLRTTQGVACTNCEDACFEQIDLHDAINSRPLSECTKCRECSSACPAHAISFHKIKVPKEHVE